jgi:hypothetical protein
LSAAPQHRRFGGALLLRCMSVIYAHLLAYFDSFAAVEKLAIFSFKARF